MQIVQLLVMCQTNQRKAMQTLCSSVHRSSSVWVGVQPWLGGDWMDRADQLSLMDTVNVRNTGTVG